MSSSITPLENSASIASGRSRKTSSTLLPDMVPCPDGKAVYYAPALLEAPIVSPSQLLFASSNTAVRPSISHLYAQHVPFLQAFSNQYKHQSTGSRPASPHPSTFPTVSQTGPVHSSFAAVVPSHLPQNLQSNRCFGPISLQQKPAAHDPLSPLPASLPALHDPSAQPFLIIPGMVLATALMLVLWVRAMTKHMYSISSGRFTYSSMNTACWREPQYRLRCSSLMLQCPDAGGGRSENMPHCMPGFFEKCSHALALQQKWPTLNLHPTLTPCSVGPSAPASMPREYTFDPAALEFVSLKMHSRPVKSAVEQQMGIPASSSSKPQQHYPRTLMREVPPDMAQATVQDPGSAHPTAPQQQLASRENITEFDSPDNASTSSCVTSQQGSLQSSTSTTNVSAGRSLRPLQTSEQLHADTHQTVLQNSCYFVPQSASRPCLTCADCYFTHDC